MSWSGAMLLFMVFGAGLAVATVPFVIENRLMFETGMAVKARIIKAKKVRHHGVSHIYLIWRYIYNGESYTYRSKRGRDNESRKPGEWGALAISKKDPSKVYEFMTPHERNMVRLIGIGIMAMPVVCLIIMELAK